MLSVSTTPGHHGAACYHVALDTKKPAREPLGRSERCSGRAELVQKQKHLLRQKVFHNGSDFKFLGAFGKDGLLNPWRQRP